jgi:hypothetical protein
MIHSKAGAVVGEALFSQEFQPADEIAACCA